MSADPAPLAGRWFDGRTSRPREVSARFVAGGRQPQLVLADPATGAPLLQVSARELRWPAAWGEVSVADLGEHGSLELLRAPDWSRAVAAAAAEKSLAVLMERRWSAFLTVAVVAVAMVFAFWRWGTPWAAALLSRHVPLGWELALSQRAMSDFDARFLKPSKLAPARQAQLSEQFAQLRTTLPAPPDASYRPPVQLAFRAGMGANAFALPGGQIVVTDGLVEMAAKHQLPDDALVGVLAHELGHVMHRHTTRLVVEQAVLNVGFGLALGDTSNLVSMGGSLLTGLAYRRGHEAEADCYAIASMAAAGRPTKPMADLLQRLDGGRGPGATLLATHPDTAARAQRLREGARQGC